jgi:hypothetical protein
MTWQVATDDPLYFRADNAFETNANYGRAKFANMLFAQELADRTRTSTAIGPAAPRRYA